MGRVLLPLFNIHGDWDRKGRKGLSLTKHTQTSVLVAKHYFLTLIFKWNVSFNTAIPVYWFILRLLYYVSEVCFFPPRISDILIIFVWKIQELLCDLYDGFLRLHLHPFSWLSVTFCCAPWADPGSLASPPSVVGLRNKIPACWVENIQIFFCSRQRMSRGVGAVRLKMGLSFRTRSLNPQKHSLGGCEPLGILCEWAHCIHLPHHSFPPISISSPVRLLSSPGGPTTAHCMHVLVLPWSEATFGRPLVSIAASGLVVWH